MEQEQTSINEINQLDVYSDGSGNSFSDDGGYGYRLVLNGLPVEDGSGYAASATNNTMENQGAIEGLRAAQNYIVAHGLSNVKVTLISDSQLVLNYANGKWRCKAEHLKPLRDELQLLYNKLKAETKWVKGHSGHVHNEAVDKLAGAARKSKGVKDETV